VSTKTNKQIEIMRNYLETLIEEKGLDLEGTIIEVEGQDWGMNFIPLGCVVDFILTSGRENQRQVRNTLVKIDFANGDVMHFFKHVASFMAK
tara:strand:- start:41 stop:316 length:276 start_codon:yes stop_codon:yes gene_type:complete